MENGRRAEKHSKKGRLQEIRARLRERLPDLAQRYRVRSLGVFGSYARAEEGRDSDLDILVDFSAPKPTFFEFIRLEMELSGMLGVKVDLVMKSALKPAIGSRIRREAVPV